MLPDLGDLGEAREYCRKALEIQEKLAASDAKNTFVKYSLARTYRRMGDITQASGQLDEPAAYYRKSMRLFEELSAAAPDNVPQKARLAEIYTIFGGFLLASAGKDQSRRPALLREAQALQNRGLEIYGDLQSRNALDQTNQTKFAAARETQQKIGEALLAGASPK